MTAASSSKRARREQKPRLLRDTKRKSLQHPRPEGGRGDCLVLSAAAGGDHAGTGIDGTENISLRRIHGLGLLLLVWGASRWPNSKAPISAFVIGTLIATSIFIWVSISRGPRTSDTPLTYYARLFAYPYDADDGTLDLDHPLLEIPLTIHDQYKHRSAHKTRSKGTEAIFQVYGPILIGACGVYHAYIIQKENNTSANALVVRIGIDPSKVESCKQ